VKINAAENAKERIDMVFLFALCLLLLCGRRHLEEAPEGDAKLAV
jgi:hypothetical protein